MSAMKSEPRALRSTISRFQKIDRLLIEIAGLWGDVDQSIVGICDDLRGRVEEAMVEVRESVDERRHRQITEQEEQAAFQASGGAL